MHKNCAGIFEGWLEEVKAELFYNDSDALHAAWETLIDLWNVCEFAPDMDEVVEALLEAGEDFDNPADREGPIYPIGYSFASSDFLSVHRF